MYQRPTQDLTFANRWSKKQKYVQAARYVQRDILRQTIPMADWYVASGSMNLLTELETRIFIQRCFEKSRKGFVFNVLEGKNVKETTVTGTLMICWNSAVLSVKKVKLKEGYLEGDFTIVLLS